MSEVTDRDRRGLQLQAGGEGRRSGAVRSGVSGGALLLSLIFTVLLITAPEQLEAARQWVQDLPIVVEVIAWITLLPWLLAHLAWQASWALWLRVLVVAVLVWGVALTFWKQPDG